MGKKEFYLMYNVGKVKYLVNYCKEGINPKTGGYSIDIACFNNKRKANDYVKGLIADGYKPISFGLTKF